MGDFERAMAFGCKFPGWVMQMEMSCLKPHLISNLPGGESACDSRGHDLLSGFMGSQGFLLGFIED